MHELSIATGLVETAVRSAVANGASRVLRVNVRIGSLSGVEPEALSFCFPIAARETVCEGAELHLDMIPAAGTCPKCGARSEVRDLLVPCPGCGEWPLSVEGGREMQLESLEVT
ncbi:MAG: hydrogenase maturation nickel metallochaperone HypA [Acidobacteriia bacterium]|nr:hydrogenase maturation nickel metallochaperone HypA [Terriglobia bacterium]